MSIKTWKEVAYPVEARLVKGPLESVDHAIRKWEHLDEATLKAHGLVRSPNMHSITDPLAREAVQMMVKYGECSPGETPEVGFPIDDTTCTLCIIHVDGTGKCSSCPLNKALGAPCDKGKVSPYFLWVHQGDTSLMLEGLKKAREIVLKEMEK